MGWFKKKADPISDRARALNEQIAALEAQIRQLDGKLTNEPPRSQPAQPPSAPPTPPVPAGPRVRSTTRPHHASGPAAAPGPVQPIFETVDHASLHGPNDPASTPEHYNDLGVRKYDLAALVRRIKNHFRGPSTTNPKLVNYLAAGSLQGLRPMRYEKRIARNRLLLLALFFLLVLWGIYAMIPHR